MPVLTGMNGKWAVAAPFIFRDEAKPACTEITREQAHYSVERSLPQRVAAVCDEEWLVLSMQVRNMFLVGHSSTLQPPDRLRRSGIDKATLCRELHAMALSGALRFRTEHEISGSNGDLTMQTVVAHEPDVLPLSAGVVLSKDGGGCEKLLGERKHLARGRPMLSSLALKLDWYLDALAAGPATTTRDDDAPLLSQ